MTQKIQRKQKKQLKLYQRTSKKFVKPIPKNWLKLFEKGRQNFFWSIQKTVSFFTHSPHTFFGQPFFLFSSNSNSLTSHMCKAMSQQVTWPYYHIQLCTKMSLILIKTPTVSLRTSPETLKTSFSQHITIIINHSISYSLNSCNSKFPSFTTVKKNQ